MHVSTDKDVIAKYAHSQHLFEHFHEAYLIFIKCSNMLYSKKDEKNIET